MKTTKIIILIWIIMQIIFTIGITAEVVVDTDWNFEVGNETYTVNDTTRTFNKIILNDNWICFNDTGFNITSPNTITIYIDYINTSIEASNDDLILEFVAETNTGQVNFNINGLKTNHNYRIKRNGTNLGTFTTNSSGELFFNNTVWSKKVFTILHIGTVGLTGTIKITYEHSGIKESVERGYTVIGLFMLLVIISAIVIVLTMLLYINYVNKEE
jgi:hypothetical protein